MTEYKMPDGTPSLGQDYDLPEPPIVLPPDSDKETPHSNPDTELFNKPFNPSPSKKEQAETADKLRRLYKERKEAGRVKHHGEVDEWTDPLWEPFLGRHAPNERGGEFTPAYPDPDSHNYTFETEGLLRKIKSKTPSVTHIINRCIIT